MRFFEYGTVAVAAGAGGLTKEAASRAPELVVAYEQGLVWDGRDVGKVFVNAQRIWPQGGLEDELPNVEIRVKVESEDEAWMHWGTLTKSTGAQEWRTPAPLLGSGITVSCPAAHVHEHDACAARIKLQNAQEMLLVVQGAATEDVVAVLFCIFLKKSDGHERWFSGPGGNDHKIHTGDPKVADAAAGGDTATRILEGEAGESWSMPSRFGLIIDLCGGPAASSLNDMAWVFVVLRYHNMRQLRWYSKHNYQSKDMGHLLDTLSKRVTQVAAHTGQHPRTKYLARVAMSYLSRGGGQAEAIRIEILHIMRRNGIKEGHRPGIDDKFIEQWHQKLHQHTTRDDIHICKAYLAFLHSGNMGDFWHTLWVKGKLTREDLASWPNKITHEPFHLPQLINDMKHYLWILQTVHGGADLGFATESAKWALDGETQGMLYDIMANYDEWWVPGKIADVRFRICDGPLKHCPNAERDILLLDAALVAAFKHTTERTNFSELPRDPLIDIADMVLRQSALCWIDSSSPESLGRELWIAANEWSQLVKNSGDRSSPRWALKALALADKISLLLAKDASELDTLFRDKTVQLAKVSGIPDSYVLNFTEEVVRAQPSFVLSSILRYLTPVLRDTAGVGPWNVVSMGDNAGRTSSACALKMVSDLANIQGEDFSKAPVIVIADGVDGNCDIPLGVEAIVSGGSVDILSHVAIRARNQGVVLVCCDGDTLHKLRDPLLEASSSGSGALFSVSVNSASSEVQISGATAGIAAGNGPGADSSSHAKASGAEKVSIAKPLALDKALQEEPLLELGSMVAGLVGGKSFSLQEIRSKLPDWLQVPKSYALPFGTAELNAKLLGVKQVVLPNGEKVTEEALQQVRDELEADPTNMSAPVNVALAKVAAQLVPEDLVASLPGGMAAAVETLYRGVLAVWASKYTYRATLSRRAQKIADADLYMAVLLQPVVSDVAYAFVLHTKDPLSGDADTVFGEVVVGMGETLVGSYPGRALAFSASKSGGGVKILSYPSKLIGYFATPGTLMARSDSNGEDLEKFAGAGLYDSVGVGCIKSCAVDYAQNRLFTDDAFVDELVSKLLRCGVDVEKAMGGQVPQDIEGCVDSAGNVTVVQTRPQV